MAEICLADSTPSLSLFCPLPTQKCPTQMPFYPPTYCHPVPNSTLPTANSFGCIVNGMMSQCALWHICDTFHGHRDCYASGSSTENCVLIELVSNLKSDFKENCRGWKRVLNYLYWDIGGAITGRPDTVQWRTMCLHSIEPSTIVLKGIWAGASF